MKKLLPILLIVFQTIAYSQDYTWWEIKHNWDGVTPWNRYIVLSPAYLGPNGLPVPDFKNGSFSASTQFKLGLEGHFSHGDNTQNLYTELFVPFCNNKIGIKMNLVPIEYYKMDTITRDKRRARDYDAKGIATGDLYFSTYIQLTKNKAKWPDILLTVNLRTALGNNLDAARYSEVPGYFFDLSFGKDLKTSSSFIKTIRPFGLVGFYSWQTNTVLYYQNDAFQYCLGLDLNLSKIKITNSLGGYMGYINDGDKPLVYRLITTSQFNSSLNFAFRFQQGFVDYKYTSFRLACVFNLSKE